IAVMYLGKIVELAAAERLFTSPSHPYTRALLSAIPTVSDEEAALIPEKIVLRGEIPSPSRVPPGCAFHPRCYARIDGCDRVVPELITLDDGHAARCILYDPALGAPGLPGASRCQSTCPIVSLLTSAARLPTSFSWTTPPERCTATKSSQRPTRRRRPPCAACGNCAPAPASRRPRSPSSSMPPLW